MCVCECVSPTYISCIPIRIAYAKSKFVFGYLIYLWHTQKLWTGLVISHCSGGCLCVCTMCATHIFHMIAALDHNGSQRAAYILRHSMWLARTDPVYHLASQTWLYRQVDWLIADIRSVGQARTYMCISLQRGDGSEGGRAKFCGVLCL